MNCYPGTRPFNYNIAAVVAIITLDLPPRHALSYSECYSVGMASRRIVVAGLGMLSLIGVFLLMNMTDPSKNIMSILLIFLLLYVVFACLIYGIIEVIRLAVPQNRSKSMSFERQYYTSVVAAFIPVSMLAMQSLRQIRLLDVVLSVSLVCLVIFYIFRRTSRP